MAGQDSHFAPKELQAAVSQDKVAEETSARLHQDLATHNTADLLKTVAQIDTKDLDFIKGAYRGNLQPRPGCRCQSRQVAPT
jgi:hypothetical protein